jgi:hypothetical protein
MRPISAGRISLPLCPRARLDPGRLHLVALLRFANLFGKFLNRPKVGGGRAVWVMPALLPVLQRLERDSVGARKYGLAHAKSFADRFRIGKLYDRSAAFVGLAVDLRDAARRWVVDGTGTVPTTGNRICCRTKSHQGLKAHGYLPGPLRGVRNGLAP